jgi:hypothetical protein
LACRRVSHHIGMNRDCRRIRQIAGTFSEVKTMAKEPLLHRAILLALGATALLLAGCVSAPGTYPDPNGPRDGDGLLVDPQTGIVLPGQSDVGF